ncbi:RNHCP domain-containing protein [bacterium]|nr:RNHCP domain-containing protein [bacterium]
MSREDFRKMNTGFRCQQCGKAVPSAEKTSRNHCPYCLYSKHVDIIPGDRMEVCQGLMKPVDYDYKHGKVIIQFRCIKCGKTGINKAAPDDNLDRLLQKSQMG